MLLPVCGSQTTICAQLGYVSIAKVFLAARVHPRGSSAGTRAGRLFPLMRFLYKSACGTRADNSNVLGDGPGGDDDNDGDVMLLVMLVIVVAMVVLVVMVMMVLGVVLLVVW